MKTLFHLYIFLSLIQISCLPNFCESADLPLSEAPIVEVTDWSATHENIDLIKSFNEIYDHDTILVGSIRAHAQLIAIKKDTFTKLWAWQPREKRKKHNPQIEFLTSNKEIILIAVNPSLGNGGKIYAIEAGTGSELWRVSFPGIDKCIIEDGFIIGSGKNEVRKFSIYDPNIIKWSIQFSYSYGSPTILKHTAQRDSIDIEIDPTEILFFPHSYKIFVLSPNNGEVVGEINPFGKLPRIEYGDSYQGFDRIVTNFSDKNIAYFTHVSKGWFDLIAVNFEKEIAWKFKADPWPLQYQLIGNHFIIKDRLSLMLLDSTSGVEIWRKPFKSEMCKFLSSEKVIYVISRQFSYPDWVDKSISGWKRKSIDVREELIEITAYCQKSGSLLWEHKIRGSSLNSISFNDDQKLYLFYENSDGLRDFIIIDTEKTDEMCDK